jgi:hypothetical protein
MQSKSWKQAYVMGAKVGNEQCQSANMDQIELVLVQKLQRIRK